MHNGYYGATRFKALWAWVRNGVNFKGRSSRSEYWWVWLFGYLASLVLNFFVIVLGPQTLSSLQSRQVLIVGLVVILLLTLVPSAALQIRRLRDAGIDLRHGVAVMAVELVMAIAFLLLNGLLGKLALVGILASGGILLWWSYQPSVA